MKKLVTLVGEEMDSLSCEYRDHLSVIEDELADVNCRLEKHYNVLETGKLNIDDLAPRIQTLRKRLEQLEAAREEIKDGQMNRKVELTDLKMVDKYVEDLRHLLMHSELSERRAFIRSFVKDISVTGDEARVTYTIPLPPEGIIQDKAGVLSIVQDGSAYRISE